MASKHRINLALPQRTADRLDELRRLTDASSVTEVVKQAILTYEAIAKHLSEGVTFSATKPDGEAFEVEFMIDVPKKTISEQHLKEDARAA